MFLVGLFVFVHHNSRNNEQIVLIFCVGRT